ncbi:MAG: DarT ssDNA thymidine ADP-ribosyltransferase family protein [Dysgonamonadaceae bacterium]|jgi:hypothetical protein|nr:DarT ssDNA thymidine ADP-ribosyltransferase family protein [Dysgonamonadaceae bacterium]
MNFLQKIQEFPKVAWNKITEFTSSRSAPPTSSPPFVNSRNEIDRAIQSLVNGVERHIVSIDREICELNDKEKKIRDISNNIATVELPDLSAIYTAIDKLNQYVSEKPTKSATTTFFKPKTTQGFEDLLKINNLLKQFQDREIARKRKEEQRKKEVRASLDKIVTCINQDKLDEAKTLISQIQDKIKASYKHEIEKLEKSKQKLKDRELQILKKRQEDEQKRQEAEAERIRIAEEKRQEALRKKREEEERIRRTEEEKRNQAKAVLNSLLVKKSNWEEFQKVLQQNDITTLYHFTDSANIISIKKHGGLFSWSYCDRTGIDIPYSGGDTMSRQLDMRYNLQDYVRVSFCDDHPMKFRLECDGRNIVLLRINIDVAYFEQTQFSDMNATDSLHSHGTTLNDLKRVNFQATKQHYVSRDSSIFKQHQAEVLVKTWIPIEYITNINNF